MRTIITAAALAALCLSACSRDDDPSEATPSPVDVSAYTLQLEPLAPVTAYASRIQAFENAHITARIEARVLERHVEGGERVSSGDTLISLDPTDAELALAQARAAHTTAQAELAEARRNFDRGSELSRTGAIAAIEMDALTTGLEAARAAVQTTQAALDYAEVTLGYTKIRAPIDGTVGLVNVSVGDLVGPGTGPLLTITRQDTVLVDIEISEADAQSYSQRMALGEDLEFDFVLELANGSIHDRKGTLFSTANTADPATGTMTARIAYENPDNILLPGQSVRVLLSEPVGAGRLAVPQAAVQQDQQGNYVMLVADDMSVSRRHVELGSQVADWWLVESGLEEGETIVTQGLQKVGDGSLVTISPAE